MPGLAPHTIALRNGLLAALAQGEATNRELEQRIGFIPPTATWWHMKNLERKGLVKAVRTMPNPNRSGGRPIIVWALTEQSAEIAA